MSLSSSLLVYGSLVIGGLIILITIFKSHHFFKPVIFNIFQGIGSLIAASIIGKLIGVLLPINWFTIAFSALGGVPAVIMILLLKILFG